MRLWVVMFLIQTYHLSSNILPENFLKATLVSYWVNRSWFFVSLLQFIGQYSILRISVKYLEKYVSTCCDERLWARSGDYPNPSPSSVPAWATFALETDRSDPSLAHPTLCQLLRPSKQVFVPRCRTARLFLWPHCTAADTLTCIRGVPQVDCHRMLPKGMGVEWGRTGSPVENLGGYIRLNNCDCLVSFPWCVNKLCVTNIFKIKWSKPGEK